MLAVMAEIFDGRPLPLTLAPSPWLRRHRMEWRDRNDRPVGRDRDSRRLISPKLKDNKSFKRIELLMAKKCHVMHNFTLCTWLHCAPSRKRGFASPDAVAQRSLGKRCCPCLSRSPFPNRGAMGQWPLHRCSGGKRIPQGAPAKRRNTSSYMHLS